MFDNIYQGKRVLITGHTGFKGSWLTAWLRQLGAEVCGVALPMPETLNHFTLLESDVRSELCDIGDLAKLQQIFSDFRPEMVFHLAAQPLVRLSYREPVFCEVMTDPLEVLGPKAASAKRADGTMVSKPLEDLFPFLDRKEFLDNMLVDPVADDF